MKYHKIVTIDIESTKFSRTQSQCPLKPFIKTVFVWLPCRASSIYSVEGKLLCCHGECLRKNAGIDGKFLQLIN